MDDSLESLLEKATNPKNKYEDWEFIMAFCDRVNVDLEGPQITLKIIVPKMRHEDEKVAMLALTLLEACVKNCGQPFHQELGKFRFLNELIKMLSDKYLGKQTKETVKARIKELLYSWKQGLPSEQKIADAYEMLKIEGLVFDEDQPPDKTLQPSAQKPKVELIEDPKQSQMLHKLLASRNPDDLRAANRLIREMVRRDDKRMQRLKRRLDELELIQNNIKLMNELLSHYKPESGDHEKQLLEELYRSLEKMRPNLFRMVSSMKQDEEGMESVLQTNDDLLRVMNSYKKAIGALDGAGGGSRKGAGQKEEETTVGGATTNTATGGGGGGGREGGGERTEGASGGGGGGGGGGVEGGVSDNILIDLADLDLGALSGSGTGSAPGGAGSSADSLLDSLGLLDLTSTPPTSQNTSLLDFPPLLTNQLPTSQPPLPTSHPPLPTSHPPLPTSHPPFPTSHPPFPTSHPPFPTSHPPFPTSVPPVSSTPYSQLPLFTLPPPPSSSTTSTTLPSSQLPLFTLPPPPSSQTPPAVGVFGSPVVTRQQAPPISTRRNQSLPSTTPGWSSVVNLPGVSTTPPQSISGGLGQIPPGGMNSTVWGALQSDPLAVLNDLFVSKEAVQPGLLPPLQVMSKNGISVTFHFTKNIPVPGVSVVVLSAINTNHFPVTNFQIQVAVPKVMRVKLQPPTSTDLAGFNPVLPPSNISQIMLLANPSKAKIRLKYRISYHQEGQEQVDMGEAADFPSL